MEVVTKTPVILSVETVRLDAASALEMTQQVTQQIHEHRSSLYILDLESVEFMDSSGLGAVISVMKSLPAVAVLRVANARDMVKTLFSLTRVDQLIQVYESVELASEIQAS